MLSVRSLTKRYGRRAALDGVSFDLGRGEVLAVVGSNGAGKSTLIKAVVGLVRFDGEVTVDGIDVRRRGAEARRHIGYVPQSPAFHPDLNVRETALFYARLRGATPTAARAAVESAGLDPHAEKAVGALSGGMRQRLALAVAQLGEPDLLLLDEPATGLDVGARLELRRFIRDRRTEDRAVLLSTHWLEDVPAIADRVLVLDEGRATFHGPASEFVDHSPTSRSRLFLRLNGHTTDAVPLLKDAFGDVSQTGEWLVVTCAASDKTNVLETLVRAGISIEDFRLEETAAVALSDAPMGEPS